MSSVFMSNQKTLTVYAMTEIEENIARAIITAVSYYVGVAFTPGIGVASELVGIIGIEVLDYITDNGDGTYTIDAELIQKVCDELGAVYSGHPPRDTDGYYNYGSITVDLEYTSGGDTFRTYASTTSFNSKYPLVACLYAWENAPYIYELSFYYMDGGNIFQFNSAGCYGDNVGSGSVKYYKNGSLTQENNGRPDIVKTSYNFGSVGNPYTLSYSIPFLLYDDRDAAQNALKTGDYSGAINYGENVYDIEKSSYYTGTYTGGNITVSAAKLDGIEEKINELNETEKSTDEKVKEIVDWLNENDEDDNNNGSGDSVSNGDSSGGSGSGGGFLSSLGDFIQKVFDFVLSLVEMLFEPILKLLDMFMDLLNKVIDIVPVGFTAFLTAMFPFFPEEWVTIISLGLLVIILLSIIRRK